MHSSGVTKRAAVALPRLQAKIDAALADSVSFEQAAQCFSELLFNELFGGVALVRVFKTLPYKRLPAIERSFVERALEQARLETRSSAVPMMPVLTLMGSYGLESDWRDRRASAGHLAIPLANAEYVQSIPMLARLLAELGLDLAVLDGSFAYRRFIGGLNGTFYVLDAERERDEAGRRIIPSQDFVSEYGIKGVFGMGGSYLDSSMVAAIVFCTEELPRSTAQRLGSVITRFKIATEALVARGSIFAASAG